MAGDARHGDGMSPDEPNGQLRLDAIENAKADRSVGEHAWRRFWNR